MHDSRNTDIVNDFGELSTVKKGDVGEQIVDKFLEGRGVVVYKPPGDCSHPFDRLCVKNRESIFIAEIKTKPKRKYYPDTGFDYLDYLEYLRFQERGINVYIFFVDEETGTIYGNWLKIISKQQNINYKNRVLEYPHRENDIIYFPVDSMEFIDFINKDDAEAIKEFSTGNYEQL